MTESSPVVRGILDLCAQHPDWEPLILLSALSVLWLKPQPPAAASLLGYYMQRSHSEDALREASLQLFLIAGFQASLEAAFQIHDVYGRAPRLASPDTPIEPGDHWMETGLALQEKVYRENVEKLRQNLTKISPELAAWTVQIGYGLVLSRPGLPPYWRELLEVAVLAAQGFPRQLHSHLRGALNLNASVEEIEIVLHVSESVGSSENARSAWQMWRRIRP